MALSLLAAIAVGQLVSNLRAFASAAFMLRRAEASNRQLNAYQSLAIDLLEYIRLAQQGTPPQSARVDERKRAIATDLATLDDLVTMEVGLISDNGGRESDAVESQRLVRIHDAIARLLAAPATSIASHYENNVRPMLGEAVADEQAEVEGVERTMNDLKASMKISGWLGVSLQIAAAGLVVVLVGRLVLDPLGRLVADIRLIGGGQLAHRVTVRRHDEFGLLAQHFNRMAGSLERGRRSLVLSNDRLESTVLERTQALSERNEELKEIDESRRRFFADVSHELRTPLTAIVGEAEVTLRIAETTVPPYRDALVSILANSTYLKRRIDDLMALARSADGTLEVERVPITLDRVATDAIAAIQSLARINGVHVRFEPCAQRLDVLGDGARLRQGLMILLDNAVKFSRKGDAVVLQLARDGQQASVSVIDEGRGIPIDDLPHVFERFYQADSGKRMGGTGLGLAIARRIAQAHDGSIAAVSNRAGGTRITISLPLDEATSA